MEKESFENISNGSWSMDFDADMKNQKVVEMLV